MWLFLSLVLVVIYLALRLPLLVSGLLRRKTEKVLKQLDQGHYYSLHNLILQITPGRTLLIDHLVVSAHGIFVLKLCEHLGQIEGTEHGDFWIKNFFRSRKKFPNPLQKCKVQTKILRELLSGARIPITPIVIFSAFAQLNVDVSSLVLDVEELMPTIKCFETVYLKKEQIQAIIAILEAKRVKRVANTARVYDIRELLQERSRLVSVDICPKCGNALMVREGKHGTYKSCSKYPKCKFLFAISAQSKEI